MKNFLKRELTQYVMESAANWLPEINDRFYDEPVIQYASATDPLFAEYKKIIGEDHLTPQEAFEKSCGKNSFQGGTVISMVLPINAKIRESNRPQKEWPSQEWVLLRTFGDDAFLTGLLRHWEDLLNQSGHQTVAPGIAAWFKTYGTDAGPSSVWSERHAAYAAGLGTFSINDGFITEQGIAVRLLSVITALQLAPDSRKAKTHTGNCLFCSKGVCGACIRRCPVGAISEKGHDKVKCLHYVYGEESRAYAVARGGSAKFASGCGLCQTNVPCECRNPMGVDLQSNWTA